MTAKFTVCKYKLVDYDILIIYYVDTSNENGKYTLS